MAITSTTVGAGSPFTRTLEGKEWTFSPLSYYEMGQFEQWMREQLLAATFTSLHLVSEDLIARTLQEAYKAVALLSFRSPHSKGFINSINGLVELAYLSLKQCHPELTAKNVALLFHSISELRDEVTTVFSVSGMYDFRKEPPTGGNKEGQEDDDPFPTTTD